MYIHIWERIEAASERRLTSERGDGGDAAAAEVVVRSVDREQMVRWFGSGC